MTRQSKLRSRLSVAVSHLRCISESAARSHYLFSIQSYFASGWAFLIPYIIFYLVFQYLNLPIHPSPDGYTSAYPPSLLDVYKTLHVTHLLLVGSLVWSRRSIAGSPLKLLWNVLPWFALSAIFLLPGLYLELPADTWTHFIRIAEWTQVNVVSDHSAPSKWGYFFIYSLLASSGRGIVDGTHGLNIIGTALSLLLCWQYFRLARASGLPSRVALTFVVFQAVLFGNNTFSFYRYYGISSSIFSQIAAVAGIACILRVTKAGQSSVYRTIFPLGACLLICAVNHPQGVAIAAIGISGAMIGKLGIKSSRPQVTWMLVAATASANALVVLVFTQGIPSTHFSNAWLTTWGNFDILSLNSPANKRFIEIYGTIGLLDILAGLILIARRQVVGWITCAPILAMLMPALALPFALILSRHNGDSNSIITFHRIFFATPVGLSLVTLFLTSHPSISVLSNVSFPYRTAQRQPHIYCAGVIAICAMLLVPAERPGFSRIFSALAQVPKDFGAETFLHPLKPIASALAGQESATIAISGAVFAEYNAQLGTRAVSYLSATQIPATELIIHFSVLPHSIVIPIEPTTLYTPRSQSALLSKHWNPTRLHLSLAAMQEFTSAATNSSYIEHTESGTRFFALTPGSEAIGRNENER